MGEVHGPIPIPSRVPTPIPIETPASEPAPITKSILYSSRDSRNRAEYCRKAGIYLFKAYRHCMAGWTIARLSALIGASDSEMEEMNKTGLYNHVDMWLDIRAARDTAKCISMKWKEE